MKLLPIYGIMLLSFSNVYVNGNCSSDVEDIYGTKAFTDVTAAYIEAFGRDCGSSNTCEATNYENTLVALNNLIEDSGGPEDSLSLTYVPSQAELEELAKELENTTDKDEFSKLLKENPPPLSIIGTADFDSYVMDETYVTYLSECQKQDGIMTPVDVEFIAKGSDAFETYGDMLDVEGGLDIDIKLELYNMPVCLGSSCNNNDLSDAVDRIILSQLLQVDVDEVSETAGVDASDYDVTKLIEQFASFESFCRLGKTDGLNTCSFRAFKSGTMRMESQRGNSSPAKANKAMTMYGIITMLASTYTVIA